MPDDSIPTTPAASNASRTTTLEASTPGVPLEPAVKYATTTSDNCSPLPNTATTTATSTAATTTNHSTEAIDDRSGFNTSSLLIAIGVVVLAVIAGLLLMIITAMKCWRRARCNRNTKTLTDTHAAVPSSPLYYREAEFVDLSIKTTSDQHTRTDSTSSKCKPTPREEHESDHYTCIDERSLHSYTSPTSNYSTNYDYAITEVPKPCEYETPLKVLTKPSEYQTPLHPAQDLSEERMQFEEERPEYTYIDETSQRYINTSDSVDVNLSLNYAYAITEKVPKFKYNMTVNHAYGSQEELRY